jgi:hypothetical protein
LFIVELPLPALPALPGSVLPLATSLLAEPGRLSAG